MALTAVQLIAAGIGMLLLTIYYLENQYSKKDIFLFYAVGSLVLSAAAAYTSAVDHESRLDFIFFAVIFIVISVYYYEKKAEKKRKKEEGNKRGG